MSKQSKAKFKRRRERLWTENPHCRGCGVLTVLPKDMPQPFKGMDLGLLRRMATLDHVVPKVDPRRTAKTAGERTRLLCHDCNQKLARVQNGKKYGTAEARAVMDEISRGIASALRRQGGEGSQNGTY